MSALRWGVLTCEQGVMSGNLWAMRLAKYFEIHPLESCNCGVLAYLVTSLLIIIWVGSSHKVQSTYWTPCFTLKNQQPQAWHESLEMIFNIVIRFKVQFSLNKNASVFQVLSML